MPFKSQAQRRKFGALVAKGEMSQETFDRWNNETGSKKLPERVSKKSKSSKPAKGSFKALDDLKAYRKKKYGF